MRNHRSRRSSARSSAPSLDTALTVEFSNGFLRGKTVAQRSHKQTPYKNEKNSVKLY
jgi:hypothetical protein